MENQNPTEPLNDAAELITNTPTESLIDEAPTTSNGQAEEVGAVAAEIVSQDKEPISETKKGTFPPNKNEAARQLFAEWLVTPKKQREPATQEQFGLKHSVHPSTLSIWKHDALFHAEYVERAKRELRLRLVQALHVVADKAEDGDLEAAELLMEASDWKAEKPAVVPVANTQVNLTLQQVIANTEEPKELPAWQQKTLEQEEVG